MKNVSVLIGAGSIGEAIIRRIATGHTVIVADLNRDNAQRVVETLLNAGFDAQATTVDLAQRASIQELAHLASSLGAVTNVIQVAGVSPSQAPVNTILRVDLYGTAVVLEIFGGISAEGGNGIVISSQSGYRMPALSVEQDALLATTPAEQLLELDFVTSDTLMRWLPGTLKKSLSLLPTILCWCILPGTNSPVKSGFERWGRGNSFITAHVSRLNLPLPYRGIQLS